MTIRLEGLAAVADRYDAFLLDMWGCIHDGVRVFPGVPDLMARLRAMGKRTVVLSNAPRLVPILVRQMPDFGIPADAFDAIVTSGEAAWQALAHDEHKLGRKFLHVGKEANIVDPATIGYGMVDDVDDADFVLATGAAGDGTLDLEALQPVIEKARARDLTMVCANPDLEVLKGDLRLLCAGTLAQRYEDIGGRTIYHGKPHRGVYEMALRLAGVTDRDRVLGIGDAMRTDVAGARGAGIHQAFIPGGIHGESLGAPMGRLPGEMAMKALCDQFGFAPTYVLAELRW
ncbi:MAG: TIGR01459 family HAD-type hydrolase [Alphaproteobacteria bacterium]|nr:TIGR01459 family HAD-type hydrolase [Alphaproteobacteria bacterium]